MSWSAKTILATPSNRKCVRSFGWLIFLMSTMLAPSQVMAQSNAIDGAVDGYVTDSTGGRLPNCTVDLRNEDTNVHTVRRSDKDGYFRFPLVPVGTYAITVKATGYADYIHNGITVEVGSEISLTPKLSIGSEAASVVVNADASMIADTSPAISAVISEAEIHNLPVVSRNIYNLFLFTPGVKGIPSSNFATPGYSIGGILRSSWNVDGLDDTSRVTTSPLRLVINTQGSIRQVQVLANGYNAEFGETTGGQLNLVTRSGENAFHGSAIYLYRPQALAAIPSLGKTKTDLQWYMYGLNLGGPVLRNRLFFFANFEHNPYVQPGVATITAATIAALKLSADQVRILPTAQNYNSPSIRVDFKINNKNSGFLRYSRFTNYSPYASNGGYFVDSRATVSTDNQDGGEAQLATVLSPGLLNEMRFGVNRRETWGGPMFPASPDDVLVTVAGYAYLGNSPSTSRTMELSNQINDNISWQHGKHFVKAGGNYESTHYFTRTALNRTFTFSGLPAVKGGRAAVSALDQYLDTVAGDIDPSTNKPYTYTTLALTLGDPSIQRNMGFVAGFIQDEYRVTRRLIATAGLRYDKQFLPPTAPDSTYIPARAPMHTRDLSFAPRLSLAYSPNERTMVRGSFGLFFDVTNLAFFTTEAAEDGNQFHSYTIAGTAPTAPVYPTIPDSAGVQFIAKPNLELFDPNFRSMYAIQSNLQVEQSLTPNLMIKFQYMFFGTRFGPLSYDSNLTLKGASLADGRPIYTTNPRPNPNYGQILTLSSTGNSSYNGLDVTLDKRMSKGLLFGVTYSWSHALGDSDQNGYVVSDPSDFRRDYGNLSTDVQSYFVGRVLYTANTSGPWLRWANGIGLSTTTMATSGRPLNPTTTDLNGDLVANDRPLFMERNSFRGPIYFRVDARVSKTFRIEKRYAFEVMAEADNLLNHTNPACSVTGCNSAVNGVYNSAAFGRLTAAAQSRVAQVGGRFTF